MAELSADEAQRLARQFLTGMASSADVSRVSAALADDATLALELLTQMQSALDDVAPSALNAEQDRSVDSRIEALIGPRIKKRGFFGWFKKLFARKPKPVEEAAPSRRRKRGAEPATPAPLPEPSLPAPSSGGDDMMEEMVPIASPSGPAEPEAPAAPAAVTSGQAFVAPQKGKSPAKARNWKPLLTELAALILVAGLGYGAFAGYQGWQARKQAAADAAAKATAQAALAKAALKPTAVPTPLPTAVPTPGGSLHRERATAAREDEPLPSQLPPTTPQAAGQLDPL
jgi:hypothetical protein